MTRYRSLAVLVLLLILAHTRVTILPGWTIPVIPLILVSAAIAMIAVLCGLLCRARRTAGHQPHAAPAGG